MVRIFGILNRQCQLLHAGIAFGKSLSENFSKSIFMIKYSVSLMLLALVLSLGLLNPVNSFAQGSLQVTIGPEEAVKEGAAWRISGSSSWNDSGAIQAGVTAGSYVVEFKEIEGWRTPSDRTVEVADDATASLTVEYVQLSGGLQIIINPQKVRDAGAQWRVVGSEAWLNSHDILLELAAGEHLIEFSEVIGWARPARQLVTVTADEVSTYSFTYEQGGTLSMIIEPSEVLEAGGGWRLAGVLPDPDEFPSGWYNTDITTIDGLRPGNHNIEFCAAPGWVKPGDMSVTVYAGRTTFVSGRYVISTETGSLRVEIEPSPVAGLGARWRRVGSDVWLESGELERGFPEGTYTIEFKPVPGWAPPGNKAISVHRGDPPARIQAFYHSPQPYVRVMNWMEAILPETLPPEHRQVHELDGWYIRYYPATGVYLGSEGSSIFYLFENVHPQQVHDLGAVDNWLPQARDAGF